MKGKDTYKIEPLTMQTMEIVWNRDNKKCVFCGRKVSIDSANACLIKNFEGGLNIPENIVSVCSDCGFKFKYGYQQEEYADKAGKYLKNYYKDDWNIEMLCVSNVREM